MSVLVLRCKGKSFKQNQNIDFDKDCVYIYTISACVNRIILRYDWNCLIHNTKLVKLHRIHKECHDWNM